MATLETMIFDAAEYLDPQHQGVHWPDPIAWDGRPLPEQARDLCVLLDARADDGDQMAAQMSADLWAAAVAADSAPEPVESLTASERRDLIAYQEAAGRAGDRVCIELIDRAFDGDAVAIVEARKMLAEDDGDAAEPVEQPLHDAH